MPEPWRVSLHGGHSGDYCGHATGSLRETLDAAVAAGYVTYGLAEHAPRHEARFLHAEEREMGWDVAKIVDDFERYAEVTRSLAEEYADRLTVLRGFETEVVPANGYVEVMRGYRDRFDFDYVVGSVHYVDEVLIDGEMALFEQALRDQGGLEPLAQWYYETVAEMVRALEPEVVGHFDLIEKYGHLHGPVDTPPIRDAARAALEAVRDVGGILDVNTAGYRKGLGHPYPAPWAVAWARDLGIPFCFGDDSHAPDQVGFGLDDARAYLQEYGVNTITALTRESDALVKQVIPLN
jgi:histidinol-phosphatase (PHP family)